MKIKDTPKVDRPREKLAKYGPEFLKDQELLAILLGTGTEGKNVIEIAQQILAKFSKKKFTYDPSLYEVNTDLYTGLPATDIQSSRVFPLLV